MLIEYTCIKAKSKGSYKRAKTAISSVVTEEKPNDNPIPEVETPDFEGYPQEIDYPDYGEDYGAVDSKIDSLDFESIVLEIRQDIAENKFLDKFLHYMELLKVDRAEFDDFLTYDISNFDDDDFDLQEIDFQINEVKVFERLFTLYCPDTGFVIPPKTNLHVREWLDRLEPDGRYFPKKQLIFFGEV